MKLVEKGNQMENDYVKKIALTKTILPQTPEEILEKITNIRELMMVYNSAIREVTTKMVIEVPVFFSNKKEAVRVEIQIRTIAMDFWASLEHQLKYKKTLEESRSIEEELNICAKTIADTDLKMMEIRNNIEKI